MIYAFDINKLDVVCKNAKIIILTDSVKYHTAKFKFSEDWEHFSKTAYFINKSNDKDEKDISVPMFLGENETVCLIPWEVLTREGQLIVSIQGVQDDTEIWTKMNRPIVLQKSDKDSNTMPQEPTIPIYNQLLNKLDSKGDSIQFEDDTLSLKSGDKVLSTARIKDKTKDYESLLNIPTLNNIEIKGNKTANDYNIGNGLKVDEAKVTYKGEEISFKDFITQYIKDNETFAKLIENKAKKFDVNSPLSKEIGNGENADILKLKDKSIDKQFLAQSIVDILENIENIDFADYSQYSTEDNFYDLSQLDENKTIFVNKAGYIGIANSFLYDWQAEEPTQKQNNVIYINANSFITVNKGENGYKSIYFITDENQYYFEKLTTNDDWKLYRTNLNAVYQTWQFAEQLDKTKQDNLISGENIKTINNESILGSGNFELPKSPITVVNESEYITESDGYKYYTIPKNGLYYFPVQVRLRWHNNTYAFTGGVKNVEVDINDNTVLYKTDNELLTTVIYTSGLTNLSTELFNFPENLVCNSILYDVDGTYVDSNNNVMSIGDLAVMTMKLYVALNFAFQNQEGLEGKLVGVGDFDENLGYNLTPFNIGKGLKLENEELSVNTEGLDISKATIEDATAGINKTELISLVKDNLQIKSVGTGLKFENGVLSLDIANGDNLKYGTSTQSTKTNENEVVINE